MFEVASAGVASVRHMEAVSRQHYGFKKILQEAEIPLLLKNEAHNEEALRSPLGTAASLSQIMLH